MLLKIFSFVSNANQNVASENLQKSSFVQIWKVHILSFHWKKINAVAILDRSVANFEVNLILDNHRLAFG